MALNKEKVMILVQRRLSLIQGISRLTAELADALSRRDEVSVNMLLQMRAWRKSGRQGKKASLRQRN